MAMVYGNRSLRMHLLRGTIGVAALVLALRGYQSVGWPALGLLGITIWMFKGCPMCWTIGLFETLASKIHARSDRETGSRRV